MRLTNDSPLLDLAAIDYIFIDLSGAQVVSNYLPTFIKPLDDLLK
jgi:hypothetical protein